MPETFKKRTITIVVEQADNEHEVKLSDIVRAFKLLMPMIEQGATGGNCDLDVPHSDMGESDMAMYDVEWSIRNG